MKSFDAKSLKTNFKSNFLFLFSAVAFFCVNLDFSVVTIASVFLGLLFWSFFCFTRPSFWQTFKSTPPVIFLLSILSTAGLCLRNGTAFYKNWNDSSKAAAVQEKLSLPSSFPAIISIAGSICSVLFVFLCVTFFWKKMKSLASETELFNGLVKWELIIYSVLFFALVCLSIFAFVQSQAFYGTEHEYDVIFSSDSPYLVKYNAYLSLFHSENDIRQPLFAVFSAPFLSIFFLFGKVFSSSPCVIAILLNIGQIAVIFVTNLILAKTLELNTVKRISFVLLSVCTFATTLFSLMMEQYIITCFWMILCIFIVCKEQRKHTIALLGASGTMITSALLLPFFSNFSPFKDFKKWFYDVFRCGVSFLLLVLTFGRADVFLTLVEKYVSLNKFTSRNLTITDKLMQFSHFVSNCFTAPDAGIDLTSLDHPSWQLAFPSEFCISGIIIFSLAIISIIINRKKIISRISAVWIAFSLVMLVVLGWGTAENGLILYSLYFGWPYLVLLFQLAEKIEEKLRVKFVIPILSVIACVGMLIINIPAIKEMLDFAIAYYPA